MIFGYGVLGVATTCLGGLTMGNYYSKPVTAIYQDLNEDNLKDIVVRTRNGTNNLFIQQHDGTYERMDEYFAFPRGKTKQQINSEKATIDEKLKELGK